MKRIVKGILLMLTLSMLAGCGKTNTASVPDANGDGRLTCTLEIRCDVLLDKQDQMTAAPGPAGCTASTMCIRALAAPPTPWLTAIRSYLTTPAILAPIWARRMSMNKDAFSGFHPSVNLAFFVAALGMTMFIQQPVYLLISMTLRFVPRFKNFLQSVLRTQQAIHRPQNAKEKLRQALAAFSATVSWAMEQSIVSADSMKSRGYGLHGRTAFSIYHFERRDGMVLA